MQHSQSITHYKGYICYFVETEELLGLNFLMPYCEKNTLVHFFPLEKHRHKMQLKPKPRVLLQFKELQALEDFYFPSLFL